MKLIPISAGHLHCDGGALFSVIPKAIWQRVCPVNELNQVKLTSRCLLIDFGDRKVLIETGAGSHYSQKYMLNNGMAKGDHLENDLLKNGYSVNEITDVFFTHLHWDHFNGAVKNIDGVLNLTFPNAKHWCSKLQWEHSKVSNTREKVAYHYNLLNFMMDSGKLELVENEGMLFPDVEVKFYDGHTSGQMIPYIHFEGKTIVYMSDMIPTTNNIPVVWLASYDLYPVTALEEKEKFLKEAFDNDYILFFEHDYYNECALIGNDEKGYISKIKCSLDIALRNSKPQ